MRLLKLDYNDEIVLENGFRDPTPPYAILSHTWGPENEEVTFDDLINRCGKSKSGYQKIRFCAEQAKRDGLRYFWVDTCCINKADFTELSESITSMFRWYNEAERCYVYLSDVTSSRRDYDGQSDEPREPRTHRTWEPSFRASRWFTRGWTLQELLAPASVEFFSRELQLLGSKTSLASLIQEATAIPVTALLHSMPLSDFPVQERMNWVATRTTIRPEDKAYCLLGIFNVFISPIYGERENAWHRLKQAISEKFGVRFDDMDFPRDAPLLVDVEELLNFLGFEQMDSRQASIRSAYPTTCAWLLKTPVYMDWIHSTKFEQHSGFLWVKGKPGAGKSTLIKYAHAQAKANKSVSHREILVSYFFNARGDSLEKSTVGMYRSLLFQLLQKVDRLQCVFDNISATVIRSPRFKWTMELLQELLTSAVRKLGSQQLKLRCFIDALDECDEHEIRNMIAHFEHLGQVADGHLYVCFASRHYPSIDIQDGLQLILEDESGHDEDLTKYIRKHLRIGNGKSLETIKTKVQVKANGVFIWVVLVIDILNKEYRRGRIFAVQQRLDEIPEKLSDLFREILRRDGTNLDDLLLCIQWILFSKIPLDRRQFYCAMVAGLDSNSGAATEWDPELVSDDDMNRFVLDCSKGLAELTKSKISPRVQFIHESVRDFLIKDGGLHEMWPELQADSQSLSHRRLSLCCQRYLTIDLAGHLPEGSSKSTPGDRKELRRTLDGKFPFLTYAVEQILHHANEAAKDTSVFLTEFDLNNWLTAANAIEVCKVRHHSAEISLLYLLAEHNCAQLIQSFFELDLPIPPKLRDRYRCPFSVALAKKNWAAIRALLGSSGDRSCVAEVVERLRVQTNDAIGESTQPYLWALCNGHEQFAEWLTHLAYTDTNTTCDEREHAILQAAEKGHIGVIRYLASKNMDDVDSALRSASKSNLCKAVELLLEAGVNFNAQGGHFRNALQAASREGKLETVKLLLNAGANVNAQGGNYGNALQAASLGGKLEIVKLLLNARANVNAQGGYCRKALQAASLEGNLEIVKLLLNAGANVNAQGGHFGNALQAASFARKLEIVKLLLNAGANVNAQGGHYGNALQAASWVWNLEIVKLLLNAGANVNAQGGLYGTALWIASYLGNYALVQLLLSAGADVTGTRFEEIGRRSSASRKNSKQIVELLRNAGAKI